MADAQQQQTVPTSASDKGGNKPDAAAPAAEKALPKLTPHEFKRYNRMAEHMDYFVSIITDRCHEGLN